MNLRQIDLNLLVALDVLLTERNVTRAGERLCLSQSAMSSTLARLRHTFDDELLVRVGRQLELTAYAEEIAAPVRQCLQQLDDMLNAKRAFEPSSSSRLFRIAATDYAVMLMLAPLVNRLQQLAFRCSSSSSIRRRASGWPTATLISASCRKASKPRCRRVTCSRIPGCASCRISTSLLVRS